MAMAVGSPDGGEDEVIATINTTPLVDVMLVLLIIFLITSPVVLKTIKVALPHEKNIVYKTRPENINLSIDKEGKMYWNQQFIPDTNELFKRLSAEAVKTPQPELHIRGDQDTKYEAVGKAIFTAQRAAIAKVAFVTEPK